MPARPTGSDRPAVGRDLSPSTTGKRGRRRGRWTDGAPSRVGDDARSSRQLGRHMVGIVLGAGSSSRLGRPKQTLPLGDTTVLGWVIRNIEASSLERVVLVV